MNPKKFFQKIEKKIDDVIFPVSISNIAGLDGKIETGLGLARIIGLLLGRIGLDYRPIKNF